MVNNTYIKTGGFTFTLLLSASLHTTGHGLLRSFIKPGIFQFGKDITHSETCSADVAQPLWSKYLSHYHYIYFIHDCLSVSKQELVLAFLACCGSYKDRYFIWTKISQMKFPFGLIIGIHNDSNRLWDITVPRLFNVMLTVESLSSCGDGYIEITDTSAKRKEKHCGIVHPFSFLSSTSSIKVYAKSWSRYRSKSAIKILYEPVDGAGCYRVIDLVDEALSYGPYGVTKYGVGNRSDKKYRYYGTITSIRVYYWSIIYG